MVRANTTRLLALGVLLAIVAGLAARPRTSYGDGEQEHRSRDHGVLLSSKDGLVVNVGQPVTVEQIDTGAYRRVRVVVQSRSADTSPTGACVSLYTVAKDVVAPLGAVDVRACPGNPKQPVSASGIIEFPGSSVIIQASATSPGGCAGKALVDVRILGSD